MSERERFEAWAVKQGMNLARFDRYRYADNEAKAAWEAWQAACPEGWQCVPTEVDEDIWNGVKGNFDPYEMDLDSFADVYADLLLASAMLSAGRSPREEN